MAAESARRRLALTLEDTPPPPPRKGEEPRPWEPLAVRLRRAQKMLLRAFGLAVVSERELPPEGRDAP